MPRNYGLIIDPIKQEDYLFGADNEIGGLVLKLDGQWLDCLPPGEKQFNYGFEPAACASFGTLNAIEILLRNDYQDIENFSDRFLAKMSGTTKAGNSPQTVAETLRHNGVCFQAQWDITPDLTDWDKWYAEIPQSIKTLAQQFPAEYYFTHEYVTTGATTLKSALQYSPLGITVSAWDKDPATGLYVSTFPNNHWVVLVGYKDQEYWIVYDTYDENGDFVKHLAWNHEFQIAKRYSITIQVKKNSQGWIDFLVQLVLSAFGLPKPSAPLPSPPPTPPSPQPAANYLELMCQAIKEYEGYYPGSRSYKNSNPGNCRYSPVGYLPIYGKVGSDKNNFAIFSTYDLGWLYLHNLIKEKAKTHPTWSLVTFMKQYAPSTDGNNPDTYATYLGKHMGVNQFTFQLKDLL